MKKQEIWLKTCVRCKSTSLANASLNPAVPGAAELSGLYCCINCGWTGAPIELKTTIDEKNKEVVKKC